MKLFKENFLLADNVQKADGFIKRTVGLLNRNSLDYNEGLLFDNCNSIHSFGMKFDFDAIYLDNNNKVVKIIQNIKPNKILPIVFKAKKTLETASGFAEKNSIKIDDTLNFAE